MLDDLLRHARSRLLGDRILDGSASAAAVFLALFVVLLLWGAAIVSWWAPIIAGSVTFLALTLRAVLRIPSDLEIAQRLDARCGLADALGTAVHFRDSSSPVAHVQRVQAERSSRNVNLANAIPFALPRSVYAIAGLGFAASVLLFVRFGIERRLSLQAPLAQVLIDPFRMAAKPDESSEAQKAANRKKSSDLMSRLGTSTPDSPKQEQLQSPPGAALASSGDPSKDGGEQNAVGSGSKVEGKMDGSSGNPAEENEAAQESQKPGGEQTGSSQESVPQTAQAGGKSKGASEGSGMLSKLRDAVASLMSKMQPQAGAGGKPQEANGKPPGQQSGQKQNQPGQAGQQPQAGGDEAASADEDQSAPGKGSGNSKDQNASAKPGSGMGHQDGSKDIRDAQQLAAMGKLSEIIGKRSANLTGEMKIESQSGPQQLRTAYTQSHAKHGQASGDVDRDEVPIEMQGYVRQYFDQVRKQAAVQSRNGKPERPDAPETSP